MPLRSSIELNQQDLKNLKRKIKMLKDFSQKEVTLSLDHAARNTVGRMKKDAPVDTGKLRREIEYTVTTNDVIIESTAIDPETKEDYAPLQEYGSRYLRPQPYFHRNIRYLISSLFKDLTRKLRLIAKN